MLHDAEQVGLGRRRGRDATTVAEADEHLVRESPGRGELLGGQAALGERTEQRIRPQIGSQEREITGEVRERRE